MAGFGWAGGAAGGQDALHQMLAEQRAKFLQDEALKQQQAQAQQQAAQFAQQMAGQAEGRALQTRQFEANEADRAGQRERQAKQDAAAAAQEQEFGGLMQSLPEHVRPIVQLRKLGVTGIDEHTLEGPEKHSAHLATDQQAAHTRTLDLEGLRHRNQLAQIDARGRSAQAVAGTRANTRATGRPVLSGDANRIAELRSSMDDLKTLRGTIAAPGETSGTGAMAKLGAVVPNVVTEMTGFGMAAKSKQAVIDRVKQVIGKALEGGVLRKEDEAKYARILPTIGDPDQVVLTKLNGLDTAIKQRLEQQIETLAQAGYNVSGFGGPAAAGADAGDDADALINELLGL
jgi:hypothetical protein